MTWLAVVFRFIGQVGGFWFLWKLLDTAWHRWRGDPIDTGCKDCDSREFNLRKAQNLNAELSRRNAALVTETDKQKAEVRRQTNPDTHGCDYRLLQQLNVASTTKLEGIYGVGPVKAKAIVTRRPFKDMQEVREILPDWLIREARRWSTWDRGGRQAESARETIL
tara:strand:+ start:255 stop:749 length:495 start_codon:yes stop_codon:yes gene_type:complete